MSLAALQIFQVAPLPAEVILHEIERGLRQLSASQAAVMEYQLSVQFSTTNPAT